MEKPVDRRDFMKPPPGATAAIALTSGAELIFADKNKPAGAPPVSAASATPLKKITMLNLPYGLNALAPSISERTVNLHYNNTIRVISTILPDG